MDIINFMQNYYQVILIGMAALGALSAILFVLIREYHAFMRWRTKIEFKLDDLEPIRKNATAIAKLPEKVEGLDFEVKGIHFDIKGIYTKIDAMSQKIDTMSKNMDTISQRMDTMSQRMDTMSQRIDRLSENVVDNNSPLSLSEYGQKLADKINAPAIATKYKERLAGMAKTQNMRPYQIQQCCFEYAANEMLKDLEKNDQEQYYLLTDTAFNEGVEMKQFLKVIGVILIDQVLETLNIPHPKIKKTLPAPAPKPATANQ